jgi:hypothetical protein
LIDISERVFLLDFHCCLSSVPLALAALHMHSPEMNFKLGAATATDASLVQCIMSASFKVFRLVEMRYWACVFVNKFNSNIAFKQQKFNGFINATYRT